MDHRLYGGDTNHENIYVTLQGLTRAVLMNGDVTDAEQLIQKSSSLMLKRSDKRMKRELAKLWYESGWKALDVGSPRDALRFFGKSLSSIRLLHEEKNHVDIADVSHGLAFALFQFGSVTDARSRFRECLDILGKARYGTKSSSISLRDRAYVFKEIVPCRDINTFSTRYIDLHQQMHGSDFANLGLVRLLVESARKSMPVRIRLYRKILGIMKSEVGGNGNHALISLVRYRLACDLEVCGELEEAEMLCRDSLDTDLRLYGNSTDHTDIAVTFLKLADFALAKDRLEAEVLYRKSYEMRYRLEGEKSGASEQAKALYKLGLNASKAASAIDADKFYRGCLDSIRRVHVIVDHVDVAIVLLRLSGILFDLGRICQAKKRFHESTESVI